MNDFVEKKIEKQARESFFKKLAMLSIMLYIVLYVTFDATRTEFSWLSSVSIYFCLACCVIFVLSRGTIKINYTSGMLLLFLILAYISTLYTPTDENIVVQYLYRLFSSVILVMLISNVVETKEDVEKIVDAFIFAGFCLAIFLYLSFGFQNLLTSSNRIDNRHGNLNIIGLNCTFSIIFSVYKIVTKKSKKRFLYALVTVVSFPAIMFSGSRKAILVLLVALVVFFLSYSKNKVVVSRIIIAILALLVIAALIYYVPAFKVMKSRIFSMLEWASGDNNTITASSDSSRMMFIKRGFEAFLNSPVWGNGFLYSYHLFGLYAHNNYIELLMDGGIICFAAYYSIYLYILRNFLKHRKTGDRAFSSFLITVLIALLFADIGVVSFYNRYILILIIICSINPSKKEE